MPLSMYQITVPVLQRGLGVLSTYMDLAEQAAETRKFDPANLVGARLAPDMLPLSGQVQRASDTAKAAMGRLGGIAVPSFPDTEASLAELKQRLANTIAFLDTVEPAQLDGAGDKTIEIKIGGFALPADRSGLRAFLGPFPNFSFHIAAAQRHPSAQRRGGGQAGLFRVDGSEPESLTSFVLILSGLRLSAEGLILTLRTRRPSMDSDATILHADLDAFVCVGGAAV